MKPRRSASHDAQTPQPCRPRVDASSLHKHAWNRQDSSVQVSLPAEPKTTGKDLENRKVEDVWKKDVWEFQAKSGSSGSCRLFLHFLGKIAVRKTSGRTPGSPRHPSCRHRRPSEKSAPESAVDRVLSETRVALRSVLSRALFLLLSSTWKAPWWHSREHSSEHPGF